MELRQQLLESLYQVKEELSREDLYQYAVSVKNSTHEILKNITFADLKRKMTDIDKKRLKSLCVVSEDEKAYWLIDYWCGKNVRGFIQMPFSRHWIMHSEASLRIKDKIQHLNAHRDIKYKSHNRVDEKIREVYNVEHKFNTSNR